MIIDWPSYWLGFGSAVLVFVVVALALAIYYWSEP